MSDNKPVDSVYADSPWHENVIRYHRRYSILLLISVFVVTGIFSVVVVWQDIRYERYDIERLRKHYNEYVDNRC